ncbi:hypothetical protein CRYUN_Cryun08bG0062800 [Craigia yunnanensis]
MPSVRDKLRRVGDMDVKTAVRIIRQRLNKGKIPHYTIPQVRIQELSKAMLVFDVMLGLEGQDIHQNNLGWSYVYVESNLRAMSMGFMLHNLSGAVKWKGPCKNRLIKQFLEDAY